MCNNTKAISFWDFLKENTLEIPIIQRDYAQGRLGKENLRKNFLADLKNALDSGGTMKLDFVYGSIENDNLNPLDGQQRLTTLWLLHWYIALRAGELSEDNCKIFRKFTYETRISSREFCQNLCNSKHFENFDGNDIIGFITNQTWFYSAWKLDPTIQSMLRMLGGTKVTNKKNEDIVDGIEELFKCPSECFIDGKVYCFFKRYWEKLTSDNVIINANVFTANAANMVSAMVGETGVKVYKTNSGSAVRLGVFNNGSETAGISFDYTTSGSGSSARTKLTLNSDNVAISGDCITVAISGDCITFSATSSFTATVQGMGAIMKGSTDGSGSFSVGYYVNGSLVPVINFIRANNQTKLNLTANNCSISGDAIDLTGKEISISSLVDGSTAVFEGGKLKLDYIDAAQIVTDGLQAGAIDANDATIENLNAVNLTVTGDSTFEGTVNGKIIAQDMYHKVAIVSSGGNNKIYKADIVMIGGNFSGLNEDVVITLPDPTQCAGKVVTIYGAQKPSQFSGHDIKLSVEGQNQTEIRTAWGTTCIIINNSTNNLDYTNEMVLRSDGSHWLVYKWTCVEVTNTGTYVKDLLSGLA